MRTGDLTAVGRQLSALPIDPRLGRMLLAGLAKHCAAEILVIVSALAVQDPRENPVEKREAARMSHERFRSRAIGFYGVAQAVGLF